MRLAMTHFEQIPVEVVKKIAKLLPDEKGADRNGENGETQDRPRHQERWREVAEQAQREPDPAKMIALVHQLIAEFDAEEIRKSPELTIEPISEPRATVEAIATIEPIATIQPRPSNVDSKLSFLSVRS
jgi:hypothetical protein